MFQINSLKTCTNGYKNYIKSRPGASVDSVRRAKKIDLTVVAEHPMFQKIIAADMERIDFVSRIKNFRPETVSYCSQVYKTYLSKHKCI